MPQSSPPAFHWPRITKLALVIGLIWWHGAALAQSCNGGRHSQDIFTTVDTSTVVYGQNTLATGALVPLRMTIYQPSGDTARKRAVVVVLFGGSFVGGTRNDWYIIETCRSLARRGYVTAAIDYRTGITAISNAEMTKAVYRATQDALSATRYLVANQQSLRIHPGLIYHYGFSAGAITALQAAYMQQDEVPAAIDTTQLGTLASGSGNAGIRIRIRGIVNNAGGVGDTAWLKIQDSVEVASIHNETDGTVPYRRGVIPLVNTTIYGSFLVHQRLTNLGIPSTLKTTNSPGLHLPTPGSAYADTFATFGYAQMARMTCDHISRLPQDTGGVTSLATTYHQVVRLAPNPAHEVVKLQGMTASMQVTIMNSLGQQLLTATVQPDEAINISTLTMGSYMIIARSIGSSSKHSTWRGRLQKQ